jgi:hypothetical protein
MTTGKDMAMNLTTEADLDDQPGELDDREVATSLDSAQPADVSGDAPSEPRSRRSISVSVRTLMVGAVIAVLAVALAVMAWMYMGARTQIADNARAADNMRHAEQIATDYSVNAAVMDYKDLGPWKQNLVKGTTPELKEKLTQAATAMEQILLPLQWSSGAQPLAAKVRSSTNGVYVVDAFVSVMTKTVQSAEELQSTATYTVTIDSNNAWQISDVGGIATAVGEK